MFENPADEIKNALDVLGLPRFITRADIKKQYRFMARKHHPDRGGEEGKMEQINQAYNILMEYIEAFRYTFDEDEIKKQYPGVAYAQRFKH